MQGQIKGRKHRLVLFFLRAVCFGVLAVMILSYALYVLTPKYDFGICSMMNLYAQPPNSIDVLAVGSSLLYSGINTNVLWSQYGIAAYNLCSAEQPFWVSYYLIREALKTQNPKVIILDAKPATYFADYSKPGRIVLSTYGIRGLENRINAIIACTKNIQEAWPYIWGFPIVHANYKNIGLSDFVCPPDNGGRGVNWKGYIEMSETTSFPQQTFQWTSEIRSVNKREEIYFRRILDLAQSENIKVLLLCLPYYDYPADHPYYNGVWGIADEYKIAGLNFNHPALRSLINDSFDYADRQHLNIRGSIVLTRRFGYELKKRFELPDRRGDEYYESYEKCCALWTQLYSAQ
ncbi:MAG TPA: hypothetical protein PLF62_01760 [Clostridia bacterium]|jgi:hypothetical protein|nr:hypothetical protein [Clostridia bacterium]